MAYLLVSALDVPKVYSLRCEPTFGSYHAAMTCATWSSSSIERDLHDSLLRAATRCRAVEREDTPEPPLVSGSRSRADLKRHREAGAEREHAGSRERKTLALGDPCAWCAARLVSPSAVPLDSEKAVVRQPLTRMHAVELRDEGALAPDATWQDE